MNNPEGCASSVNVHKDYDSSDDERVVGVGESPAVTGYRNIEEGVSTCSRTRPISVGKYPSSVGISVIDSVNESKGPKHLGSKRLDLSPDSSDYQKDDSPSSRKGGIVEEEDEERGDKKGKCLAGSEKSIRSCCTPIQLPDPSGLLKRGKDSKIPVGIAVAWQRRVTTAQTTSSSSTRSDALTSSDTKITASYEIGRVDEKINPQLKSLETDRKYYSSCEVDYVKKNKNMPVPVNPCVSQNHSDDISKMKVYEEKEQVQNVDHFEKGPTTDGGARCDPKTELGSSRSLSSASVPPQSNPSHLNLYGSVMQGKQSMIDYEVSFRARQSFVSPSGPGDVTSLSPHRNYSTAPCISYAHPYSDIHVPQSPHIFQQGGGANVYMQQELGMQSQQGLRSNFGSHQGAGQGYVPMPLPAHSNPLTSHVYMMHPGSIGHMNHEPWPAHQNYHPQGISSPSATSLYNPYSNQSYMIADKSFARLSTSSSPRYINVPVPSPSPTTCQSPIPLSWGSGHGVNHSSQDLAFYHHSSTAALSPKSLTSSTPSPINTHDLNYRRCATPNLQLHPFATPPMVEPNQVPGVKPNNNSAHSATNHPQDYHSGAATGNRSDDSSKAHAIAVPPKTMEPEGNDHRWSYISGHPINCASEGGPRDLMQGAHNFRRLESLIEKREQLSKMPSASRENTTHGESYHSHNQKSDQIHAVRKDLPVVKTLSKSQAVKCTKDLKKSHSSQMIKGDSALNGHDRNVVGVESVRRKPGQEVKRQRGALNNDNRGFPSPHKTVPFHQADHNVMNLSNLKNHVPEQPADTLVKVSASCSSSGISTSCNHPGKSPNVSDGSGKRSFKDLKKDPCANVNRTLCTDGDNEVSDTRVETNYSTGDNRATGAGFEKSGNNKKRQKLEGDVLEGSCSRVRGIKDASSLSVCRIRQGGSKGGLTTTSEKDAVGKLKVEGQYLNDSKSSLEPLGNKEKKSSSWRPSPIRRISQEMQQGITDAVTSIKTNDVPQCVTIPTLAVISSISDDKGPDGCRTESSTSRESGGSSPYKFLSPPHGSLELLATVAEELSSRNDWSYTQSDDETAKEVARLRRLSSSVPEEQKNASEECKGSTFLAVGKNEKAKFGEQIKRKSKLKKSPQEDICKSPAMKKRRTLSTPCRNVGPKPRSPNKFVKGLTSAFAKQMYVNSLKGDEKDSNKANNDEVEKRILSTPSDSLEKTEKGDLKNKKNRESAKDLDCVSEGDEDNTEDEEGGLSFVDDPAFAVSAIKIDSDLQSEKWIDGRKEAATKKGKLKDKDEEQIRVKSQLEDMIEDIPFNPKFKIQSNAKPCLKAEPVLRAVKEDEDIDAELELKRGKSDTEDDDFGDNEDRAFKKHPKAAVKNNDCPTKLESSTPSSEENVATCSEQATKTQHPAATKKPRVRKVSARSRNSRSSVNSVDLKCKEPQAVHIPTSSEVDHLEILSVDEMVDEMRILAEVEGLFYSGRLNALQPPDVYGITLDHERGVPPHAVFSAEEVLEKCIREVKPSKLEIGLRICAYWSPQYSGLYAGRIASDYDEKSCSESDMIPIEFDDGDTGLIKMKEIRMLSKNHPHREYDPNPLLTLEKKHRRRRHSSMLDGSNKCTGDHEESDCGESYCAKMGKFEDISYGGKSKSKSLYWTWTSTMLKGSKKNRKSNREYFGGIQRGDEVINLGDSAIFISNGNERPFIGRIVEMWEQKDEKTVKVKWFYHPEEVKTKRKLEKILKYPGALFESPHTDSNNVQTIAKKCEVLEFEEFKEKYKQAQRPKLNKRRLDEDERDLYYIAGFYDPYSEKLKLSHQLF